MKVSILWRCLCNGGVYIKEVSILSRCPYYGGVCIKKVLFHVIG